MIMSNAEIHHRIKALVDAIPQHAVKLKAVTEPTIQKELELLNMTAIGCMVMLGELVKRLPEQPPTGENRIFDTTVGVVKCHDGAQVVYFPTFPDASELIGKRVRVRLEVIE